MNLETTFDTTHTVRSKLHDAERRLRAPITDILNRWVVDEKLSTNQISSKLDISHTVVSRLIEHTGLKSQHDLNSKNRKSIRSKFN